MKIKIFSMGGTIDKLYFDDLSRYEVGDPQVAEVLKEAEVHFDYDVEDVVRKDSLRLTVAGGQATPHRPLDSEYALPKHPNGHRSKCRRWFHAPRSLRIRLISTSLSCQMRFTQFCMRSLKSLSAQ